MNAKNFVINLLAGALGALLVSFGVFGYLYMNPTVISPQKVEEKSANVISSSYEQQIINTVKQTTPAVVSVVVSKDVPVLERYYESNDPFADIFGKQSPFSFSVPQYRQKGTEKKDISGGSGFIVSEDGYVVTNKHVIVEENADYTVITNDGTKYAAKVIASDALNDIAVLKIEANDLPYLKFANSDELEVGQTVLAIGNPLLEFQNSVSVGVISGLSRSIVAGSRFGGMTEQLEGVIQTDAAINPGNSGGPLLNLSGEVIGMNVAMASAENIGFALPANLIDSVVQSVKEHGKIIRPYLGIRYVPITEALKEQNNLDVDYGVVVIRGETVEELAVIPGSPADKAGILENDIILEIDGEKLNEEVSLVRLIAGKKIGDTIKVKILRKGEEQELEIKLEEFTD